MRKGWGFLVVLAIAFPAPWCSAAQGQDREKPVKPLLSLLGNDSKLARKGYHRIESPEAWKRLWLRHATGREKPAPRSPEAMAQAEVDFARCMVVAVFQGKGENCNGFRVHSVVETDELITVRVQGLYFATARPEGRATAAWGIFLLPRSAKRLRVELDTRSEKVAPPRWTQVAEFKVGNASLEK